ncbi:DUF3798 domain-containing protein [uncultured Cetobacterium sp.]|uniref:DUF3798 domain-containing protein n=1 Tax=uncultured Cetobacterium sp. TaxID=527638 RepID=UPI00261FF22D|nr:DUF3798 domain-containing protein [uncultured Cetobacterium sp.]
MRKILTYLLATLFSVFTFAEVPYHIGVITGTVSQSEDGLRGAEEAIKIYGAADKGGEIVHVTYPDNFMQEMETTISQMVSLADDPKMKAIVIGEAIPGTVEAFRRIREKRPDILLLANSPHEDPEMIGEVSDLVVNPDSIARGYLIVKAAKEMGADKFMHISFPRHMSYELLSKRRNIMRVAANDLGMEFIEMTAPDPVSDVGVAGAQQYILEQVPSWINKYGSNVAFFATNDAHTEPLLKRVSELGGYFVEADLPSPTMGYPGALGIQFTESEKGNWPKILGKVEKTVVDKGASGRMGTWAYSYNFAVTVSLVDLAKNVLDGKSKIDDFDSLKEVLSKNTPGAQWNGSNYVDVRGVEKDNFYLLYQDTYVLGKGYLKMTELEVPEKYFSVK